MRHSLEPRQDLEPPHSYPVKIYRGVPYSVVIPTLAHLQICDVNVIAICFLLLSLLLLCYQIFLS
jgi:hypothetical protein